MDASVDAYCNPIIVTPVKERFECNQGTFVTDFIKRNTSYGNSSYGNSSYSNSTGNSDESRWNDFEDNNINTFLMNKSNPEVITIGDLINGVEKYDRGKRRTVNKTNLNSDDAYN